MSYAAGWAAVNLEMQDRVPRTEFDAESHWPLVHAVTGIQVDRDSPEEHKERARRAFVRAVDDIAATGAAGFFFEPLTDLSALVERYGQTHILIGNVDTRALLTGTREVIRSEVERCIALGKNCPGYFIGVTNMIPINTPVESALYYDQAYRELSRR